MRTHTFKMALAVSFFLGLGIHATADDYAIDAAHSGVSFQISHLGLSYVQGRFNEFSGSFTIDSSDPGQVVVRALDQDRERRHQQRGTRQTSRVAPTSSTSSSFRPSPSPARRSSRSREATK